MVTIKTRTAEPGSRDQEQETVITGSSVQATSTEPKSKKEKGFLGDFISDPGGTLGGLPGRIADDPAGAAEAAINPIGSTFGQDFVGGEEFLFGEDGSPVGLPGIGDVFGGDMPGDIDFNVPKPTVNQEAFKSPISENTVAALEKQALAGIAAPRQPAPQIAGPADVTAQEVNAPRLNLGIGGPGSFRAATQQVTRAQSQAQQARGQQQEATALARAAALGETPSAAELQLQRGLEESLRQSAALAGSARGGAGAQLQAMRGAATQQAALAADVGQQTAILRAQEQERARGQLLEATEAVRQGDISQQQAALQQAGLGAELSTTQAEMVQQAAIATQNAVLQADLANQGAALQAELANQAAILKQTGLDDAQIQVILNSLIGVSAQQQAGAIAGEQARLEAILEPARIEAGIAAAEAEAEAAFTGGLLGAAGQVGAAGLTSGVISDVNTKENIADADSADFEEFLNSLSAKTYDYKEEYRDDPRAPEGRQFGIIAQDLNDSELGQNLLIEDTDGVLGVDIRKATSVSLGAIAHLNERIKKLEKKDKK